MNLKPNHPPRPSTMLAVAVAGIATTGAYLAMVAFGTDVVGMHPATAYATAGVYELSLVTVAVLAREAAQDNRPTGVLLTLTWMLSGGSGAFAAWHEAYIGHDIGAIAFRLSVPALAALMWHLALIGDRHLATGTTWTQARRHARMNAYVEAVEAQMRATDTGKRHQIKRAERRLIRARRNARTATTPTSMVDDLAAYDAQGVAETATITTARHNHARQIAAFGATNQVEPVSQPVAPEPVQMVATIKGPTQVAPTHNPVAQPVAEPVAEPTNVRTMPKRTVAATTPTATTTARVTNQDAASVDCKVCGNPLKPGSMSPYCTGKDPETGARLQRCKNKWNGAQYATLREEWKRAHTVTATA